MKVCDQCGIEKSFDHFQALKRQRHGSYYSASCLDCRRLQNRKYGMASHWRHREERLAKMKVIRERDTDGVRQRSKDYYQANAERLKERQRAYYANNRQKSIDSGKAWRQRNPDRYRRAKLAAEHRRRAMLAGVVISSVDLRSVWERDGGVCQLCLQPVPFEEMSPDHIVPVSKGGAHATWNIQASHRQCNINRKAKPMSQVIQERNIMLEQRKGTS